MKAPIWAFFYLSQQPATDLTPIGSQFEHLSLQCVVCDVTMNWKRKNGTSSLINHVEARHMRLFSYYKDQVVPQPLVKRRKNSSLPTTGDIRKIFKTTLYGSEVAVPKKVLSSLSLLVGKSLRPLSTAECPWTRKLLHEIDPRISFPSRKALTNVILPRVDAENEGEVCQVTDKKHIIRHNNLRLMDVKRFS